MQNKAAIRLFYPENAQYNILKNWPLRNMDLDTRHPRHPGYLHNTWTNFKLAMSLQDSYMALFAPAKLQIYFGYLEKNKSEGMLRN
jgi:hypothetical protein